MTFEVIGLDLECDGLAKDRILAKPSGDGVRKCHEDGRHPLFVVGLCDIFGNCGFVRITLGFFMIGFHCGMADAVSPLPDVGTGLLSQSIDQDGKPGVSGFSNSADPQTAKLFGESLAASVKFPHGKRPHLLRNLLWI